MLTGATRRVFEKQTTTLLDLFYNASHNLAQLRRAPRRQPDTRPVRASQGREPARYRCTSLMRRPNWPWPVNRCLSPELCTPSRTCWPVRPDNPAFFFTAQGVGRVQSRHRVVRHTNVEVLSRSLEDDGIFVRGKFNREKPRAIRASTLSSKPATSPG